MWDNFLLPGDLLLARYQESSIWLASSWCATPRWVIIIGYYRRKFRSQTSDNMERWKAEQGRGTEKRKIRREKIRRERVRGQKIQMREKVGKSRNTVFFQWFVAQEGRKVGSLKRRVRSQLATGAMKNCTPLWREAHFQVKIYKTPQAFGPLLEVEMSKKCTPLWREAHFQVKMYKTPQRRTTFGSWDVEKAHAVVARSTFPSQNVQNTLIRRTTFGSCDVEKVHAVVARSTFPSQNVQNTSASDHFWKLRCRKSARRCGAKHISKSKCTKHTHSSDHFWKLRCRKSARRCGAKHISKSKCTKHLSVGPLLEVEMSKKRTLLWREAHFQVKMYKTHHSRTTFGSCDVEKVHAVVARSTFPSQKC